MEDRPGDPREEPTAAEAGGFLPPEPPGPEPELGTPGAPEPPAPPPPAQQPPSGWQPPPPAAGWQQPPPPGWHQQAQGWPQQPQQPPAWSPPNAGFPAGAAGGQWPPPPPGTPVWAPPAPPVPGNSQAVAGFVLSVVGAGLLVVTLGFSSVISILCAVLGIVFSRKGRQNVEEGRTPKHKDLAKAGFITGIVTLVVTILVTVAWVLVIVAGAADDGGSFDGSWSRAPIVLG